MKNKKVISYKNLPTKFPVILTLVIYLYLDKFQVSGIVWGIVGTLLVIMWLGSIYNKVYENDMDILNQDEKSKN